MPPPTVEPETSTEEALDTPWNVVVHNDPVNLMSYVVRVFQTVFGFSREKAEKHMLEVHQLGRSIVWSGVRERAEAYVQQLHGYLLLATFEKTSYDCQRKVRYRSRPRESLAFRTSTRKERLFSPDALLRRGKQCIHRLDEKTIALEDIDPLAPLLSSIALRADPEGDPAARRAALQHAHARRRARPTPSGRNSRPTCGRSFRTRWTS